MFSSLPRQFGRYEVRKKLGQGGMGAVFLAHDSQLHRPVALKIPSIGADQPAVLARFQREARAAAILQHPGICPVFDVGELDGIHYLAMAYIEGKPLASFIRGGKPLPVSQAVGVMRKIAMAIQEAHKRGVVHRDLKPANIMINRRGQPIIMDFGLAQVTATVPEVRLTRSGSWLGTPAYMAPEQIEGDTGAMGPASDIYSMGVILYELLTGRLPFDGATVGAVFAKVMSGKLAPPSTHRPDLDPAIDAICCKAMARNAQDRYANADELVADLTAVLKGSGGSPVETATGATAESHADHGRTQADVSTPGFAETRTFLEHRKPAAESAARRSWAGVRKRRHIVFTCVGILALAAAAFTGSSFNNQRAEDSSDSLHLAAHISEVADAIQLDSAAVDRLPETGKVSGSPGSYALDFDGRKTHVALPTMKYGGKYPFTVEATVKVDRPAGGTILADLEFAGFGLKVAGFTVHAQSKYVTARVEPSAIPRGKWIHIAGVFDHKEIRFYLDGKLKAVSPCNGYKASKLPVLIGGNPSWDQRHADRFAGQIRQIRVSKTARFTGDYEPEEVFSQDEHTYLLYRFNEGKGSVLHNSASDEHHGIIHQGKWVKLEP